MYPYMSIYAVCSVASHCDAHFCAYKICIFTNNVVYIKYRTQNPMQLKHLYSPQTLVLSVTAGHIPPSFFVFRCYYNIQPPMCLLNISPKPHTIYNSTNNVVPIQYLPQKNSPPQTLPPNPLHPLPQKNFK